MSAAVALNFGFAVSLKNSLPRQVQTAAIVPHVHDFLINERFSNSRIDFGSHFVHVADHGLASLLRRLHAVEEQPHGPIALVSALVMQRYLLLRRGFGSRVYLVAQSSARRGSIDVIQRFSGNAVDYALESLRVREVESSEQDASVIRQIKLNVIPVVSDPLC